MRQRRLSGESEYVTARRQEHCDRVAAVVTGAQVNSRDQSILPAGPVMATPRRQCPRRCGDGEPAMFSAIPLTQRYAIVTRTGPKRTE